MRKFWGWLLTVTVLLICLTGAALAEHQQHASCGLLIAEGGSCPTTGHEYGKPHPNITTWEPFTGTSLTVGAAETRAVYLTGDVTLTAPITVEPGGKLMLCLNGETLTMGVDGDAIVLQGTGSWLSVCDCSDGKTGVVTRTPGTTGRAIYAAAPSDYQHYDRHFTTLYLYGGTYTGHSAPAGEKGAALYLENTIARLFTCEISENTGDDGCGAVYVCGYNINNGLLMYDGAAIVNNTGTGGVVIHSGHSYNIDHYRAQLLMHRGSSIAGNSSTYGGGVALYGSAEMHLDAGADVSGNSAVYGGGIYIGPTAYPSDGVRCAFPHFLQCGGSVQNNTATYGGGVYSESDMLLSGGLITGNSADYGGGIHAGKSHIWIYEATITGNSAVKAGGGILFGADGTDVSSNGKMVINYEAVSANDRYIRKNYVGSQENNIHLGNGKYIQLWSGYNPIGDIGITADMTGETYAFLADGEDCGIAEADLAIFSSDQGYGVARNTKEHGIITKAMYAVNVEGGTGGGSYREGAKVTVKAVVPQGKTFIGWQAKGVTLSDRTQPEQTFTMPANGVWLTAGFGQAHEHTPCAISGCADPNHPNHDVQSFTGWNGATSISVASGTAAYYLTDDTAYTSGYISVSQGATLYLCLNGHQLSKNYAFLVQGTLHLCDCQGHGKVVPTSADRAARVYNTGRMYMYAGTLSGHAPGVVNGGAILNEGVLHIFGGVISDNQVSTSSNKGGAIYSTGHLYIRGGVIQNNKAYEGGGVYAYADHASDKVVVSGGRFTGNRASDGGGMYLYGSSSITPVTIPIQNAVFSANQSTSRGGGLIAMFKVNLEIADSSFANNKTTANGSNGGGMYLDLSSGTNLKIQRSAFTGNTAVYGGGAMGLNGMKAELTDVSITGNKAAVGAGISGGKELILTDVTITGNEAVSTLSDASGGGVQVGSGAVKLYGSTTITGNTAKSKTDASPRTDNLYLGYSASTLPVCPADFEGQVGVGVYRKVEKNGPQPFIADATGAAVSNELILNHFTSDQGYGRRVNAAGQGEFFLGKNLTVIGGTGSGDYASGDKVTITANAPKQGEVFDGWVIVSGTAALADDQMSTTTLTMSDTAVTVKATYKGVQRSVALKAEPADGGTVAGDGVYLNGSEATVTATAETGYEFVGWSDQNGEVSAEASYTFTVTADVELTAHFARQQCSITISAAPPQGGTVIGGGSYAWGETVTVKAEPASGWTFLGWREGTRRSAAYVSTDQEYAFKALSSVELIACFEQTATPPQTGDSMQPELWTALMLIALGTMAVLIRRKECMK